MFKLKFPDDIYLSSGFFMIKSQTIIVDNTELELTNDLIERYKHTTRKKRVTKRGIEKFYNKLIEFMLYNGQ
jgi:hypothetical protein